MSLARASERLPVGAAAVPSILVVDDREANLLALEAILDSLHVNIVRASSGEEALKHLLKHDFALILLDVQMPIMDGFETAEAIKSHPRTAEIPIIFVTAISREVEHIFKGYQRGAVDYILKPFDPYILKAKVAVFVELFLRSALIKAQAKLLRERELDALKRHSEQRYRRLTDLMPLVVWATRADGTIFYVNGGWTEYSGLVAETTVSIDHPLIVHPEDVAAVRERWPGAPMAGPSFEMQCRLRRADGVYRWHLVRGVAEHNERGGIEGWIVAATDIEDQKSLEQSRERLFEQEHLARDAAESANRMKDDFLANLSHELRTPLNAILGWTKMLRSGMVEESRRPRALETIERNALLQVKLIEDLLDVSRIVSGKLILQTRSVDVVGIVQAAFDSVRLSAESKGVELTLVSCPPEEIPGDPDRLQQILGNLIVNAVKFTPKGGRVDVRVELGDAMVGITVTDTGVGIAPEFLPHIFDRFRQAGDGVKQHGLGLGLAIVRHLVALHGGRVEAQSRGLGLGASFKVSLPRGVIREPKDLEWFDEDAADTEPSPDAVQLSGLRVLFVDDHADARALFTEMFERCGAKVVAVSSVAAAIDTLGSSTPHVLVSDIELPDQDGYALIRRVRALGPDAGGRIPAIAVSGVTGGDCSRRALQEGFQLCLAKPVNPAELIGLVASLADGGPADVSA